MQSYKYDSYLGCNKNNEAQNSHQVGRLALSGNSRQRMRSPYYPLNVKLTALSSLFFRDAVNHKPERFNLSK